MCFGSRVRSTVLYAEFGPLPYLDQVFLIRLANTIVGAHGGGMWNAARWLNAAQRQLMVEIVTVNGPANSCSLARMFGGRYRRATRSLFEFEPQLGRPM